MLFKDLQLIPELQKTLEEMGYATATDIQTQVIQHATNGKNIIGQSQTGTGKTAAFLLPILSKIDANKRDPQALIIAPTRELVDQIRQEAFKLTKYMKIRSVAMFGGSSAYRQKDELRRGAQLIIATPGRLMDFMSQGLIDTKKIEFFVLDEVDRMLDMGFIDDIKDIWDQLTELKQVFTFSATINDKIKRIIKDHLTDYEHIQVSQVITVDKIDHSYVDVHHQDKVPTLIQFLQEFKDKKIVIFTQTKRNTEVITDVLLDEGHNVKFLNGDLRQSHRIAALKAFKEGRIKTLVTTDVAARGLNMENVELVINFDVPQDPESYIHRIGRTGRAGAEGRAVMFVSRGEYHLLGNIEKEHRIKIKLSDIATTRDDEGKFKNINLDMSKDRGGRGRSGGFGGRSSGGFGGRSSGGYSDRGGDRGGRSSGGYDRPPRSFVGRDNAGFDKAPRSAEGEAPRREFTPRSPQQADTRARNQFAPRSFERSNDRPSSGGRSSGGYSDRGGERPARSFGSNDRPSSGGRSSGGYSSDRPARSFGSRDGGSRDGGRPSSRSSQPSRGGSRSSGSSDRAPRSGGSDRIGSKSYSTPRSTPSKARFED